MSKVVWTVRVLAGGIAALVILSASPARAAQPPSGQPTAAQDQYVPVDRPMNAKDTLPAPRLLATAYAFVWVVLLAYVWSVRKRLSTVEREIESVTRRTAPRGGPA